MVLERADDDPSFVLSVSTLSPDSPDLHGDLETNTDGYDFDDDFVLPTSTISNLRVTSGVEDLCVHHATLDGGNFVYTGDEDLTDNDAEGESDPEFDGPATSPSFHMYRNVSAMSSSSSLAGDPLGEEDDSSDAEESLLSTVIPTTQSFVVPTDLIGKTFVIED